MTNRPVWKLCIRMAVLSVVGLAIAWMAFHMTAVIRDAYAIACDAAGPTHCPNISVDIVALRWIGGLLGMSFPLLMSALLEWCDYSFD